MSEITSSQYVTHVREGFTPSRPLEDSLNVFLERPTSDLRLYTTVDRRVPTEIYYSDEYQRRNVRSAERGLRRLGRKTLGLSANVMAREDEGGLTLFFGVIEQDQPDFNRVTDILNYFEHQERMPGGVYLHIARSSLAKSGEQRVLARAKLLRRMSDPFAEQQMRIGQPQLVSRDISVKPQMHVDLSHIPRQLHSKGGD